MLWFTRHFSLEHTYLIYSLNLAGRRHGGKYICGCGSHARPASPHLAGGAAAQAGVLLSGRFLSEQGPFGGYNAYCIQYECVQCIQYIYTHAYRYIFPVYTVVWRSGTRHTQEQLANYVKDAEQEQVPGDVLLCPVSCQCHGQGICCDSHAQRINMPGIKKQFLIALY